MSRFFWMFLIVTVTGALNACSSKAPAENRVTASQTSQTSAEDKDSDNYKAYRPTVGEIHRRN